MYNRLSSRPMAESYLKDHNDNEKEMFPPGKTEGLKLPLIPCPSYALTYTHRPCVLGHRNGTHFSRTQMAATTLTLTATATVTTTTTTNMTSGIRRLRRNRNGRACGTMPRKHTGGAGWGGVSGRLGGVSPIPEDGPAEDFDDGRGRGAGRDKRGPGGGEEAVHLQDGEGGECAPSMISISVPTISNRRRAS